MSKKAIKPGTYLLPTPAVLVTCRDSNGKANALTIAWSGVLCSEPPMLSVAIRPSRLSHGIIKETRELVVNVPPRRSCARWTCAASARPRRR